MSIPHRLPTRSSPTGRACFALALIIYLCGALTPATAEQPAITRAVVSEQDISAPRVWGAAGNVVQVKHLYFSAQPDAEGIREAQAAGVEVVINLRHRDETQWDEATAVTQAGLAYYQVPISSEGPGFDQHAMRRISDIVASHGDQPIWLHCSSGNRASAWLAVHLVQDHQMTVEQSLALARKVGLTNEQLEKRVYDYLAAEPVAANSGD
ncbi:MAG: hypothetical protein ACFHXK_18500 [bacterium]